MLHTQTHHHTHLHSHTHTHTTQSIIFIYVFVPLVRFARFSQLTQIQRLKKTRIRCALFAKDALKVYFPHPFTHKPPKPRHPRHIEDTHTHTIIRLHNHAVAAKSLFTKCPIILAAPMANHVVDGWFGVYLANTGKPKPIFLWDCIIKINNRSSKLYA